MDCLATKGQPLAVGAGLAPSTINRFLAPGTRHRLRPQTVNAIVTRAYALSRDPLLAARQASAPQAKVVALPCYPLVDLPRDAVHRSAPVYSMPFADAFLRSMCSGDTDALLVALVEGDAMAPTAGNGDHVLVDEACDRLREDGLYVLSAGSRRLPLLRRVTLDPNGTQAWVTTDNARYATPPAVDLCRLAIYGRVLWIGKRL